MRTNELHRLREERELHLRQLEDLETNKASLLKMTARVEDLQAQLDEKIRMERYHLNFYLNKKVSQDLKTEINCTFYCLVFT